MKRTSAVANAGKIVNKIFNLFWKGSICIWMGEIEGKKMSATLSLTLELNFFGFIGLNTGQWMRYL